MPITNDLADLPTDRSEPEGHPPVAQPVIVDRLARAWYDAYLDSGQDSAPSMVEGARWRASWSGMCARAVGYNVQLRDAKNRLDELPVNGGGAYAEAKILVEDLAPTDPPGLADAWRFGLGTFVHEGVQAVVEKAFPGARSEVSTAIDEFGSATVDIVIDEPDPGDGTVLQFPRTVVELKSMGGFAFKLAASNFKGHPEGPRSTAITQGAVSAYQLNADRLIVGLLSLENLSPDLAARCGLDEVGRFAGEWHYSRDEFVPIAEKELTRVRRILEVVDAGELPPRSIPDIPSGARVDDPSTGAWTRRDGEGRITLAGKWWGCAYCDWQTRCIRDGGS